MKRLVKRFGFGRVMSTRPLAGLAISYWLPQSRRLQAICGSLAVSPGLQYITPMHDGLVLKFRKGHSMATWERHYARVGARKNRLITLINELDQWIRDHE